MVPYTSDPRNATTCVEITSSSDVTGQHVFVDMDTGWLISVDESRSGSLFYTSPFAYATDSKHKTNKYEQPAKTFHQKWKNNSRR